MCLFILKVIMEIQPQLLETCLNICLLTIKTVIYLEPVPYGNQHMCAEDFFLFFLVQVVLGFFKALRLLCQQVNNKYPENLISLLYFQETVKRQFLILCHPEPKKVRVY